MLTRCCLVLPSLQLSRHSINNPTPAMEGPTTASSSSSSLLLPAVQAVFAGSLAQFEQVREN
jgi:hypothetical protein